MALGDSRKYNGDTRTCIFERIVEALRDRIIAAVQLVSVLAHGRERNDSDDVFVVAFTEV